VDPAAVDRGLLLVDFLAQTAAADPDPVGIGAPRAHPEPPPAPGYRPRASRRSKYVR
jgi:hypothetical protein